MLIFIITILVLFAGVCEAIVEALYHTDIRSSMAFKNENFWNPHRIEHSKYLSDNVTPRFKWSNTHLAFLTNATPLFKTLGNLSVLLIITLLYFATPNLAVFLFFIIVTKVISGVYLKNALKTMIIIYSL